MSGSELSKGTIATLMVEATDPENAGKRVPAKAQPLLLQVTDVRRDKAISDTHVFQ